MAAESGSTGSTGSDGVWAAAAGVVDSAQASLQQLEQRKKALRAERDQVNKDIRNADKKRARLVEKARGLSDDDLMNIIACRAAAKSKAAAKAKATSTFLCQENSEGKRHGDKWALMQGLHERVPCKNKTSLS